MTYHIKLSNGSVADISSTSAAQAMCTALERNPGQTITQCWSGDGLHDPDWGFIDYEVPAHRAVSGRELRAKSAAELTPFMFPEAEMPAHNDTA